MNTCIAVVSDMIFATRISATAEKIGANCITVGDSSALLNALQDSKPATVLVDMSCDGIAPADAIRAVKSRYPDSRVVAFFSHLQTELMEQAADAGADDTWPRSMFVQRLPELLEACVRRD